MPYPVAACRGHWTAAGAGPLIYDTFTDTNGTALTAHTPDIVPGGSSYAMHNGALEIQSNKLQLPSGTNTAYANINSGASDVTVSVDYVSGQIATNDLCYQFGRYTDATHYWYTTFGKSAGVAYWTLRERNGGVSVRATGSPSFADNTLYVVQTVFSGTSITSYVDAASISYSSSFNQNATYVGPGAGNLGAITNNNTQDEFTVTTP